MRGLVRGATVVAVACALGPALAACSGDSPDPGPAPGLTAPPAERDALAGLAAAAKDRRYVATYTLAAAKRPDRTVTVAVASDGSWVVAVPGGALDGLADVAVFQSRSGLYQCALGPAVGAATTVAPGCVKVSRLTGRVDPRVQHIFTDWIDALVDRATALSVTAADPLPGAEGRCFSVESTSAALAPPVDPGIYCYRPDGQLTAARVGFGTLRLTGPIGDAPSTVEVPAPVVDGDPLPIGAPPPTATSPAPAT